MKILHVNKFHWRKGGADAYYLDVSQALAARGHKISYFAMQHAKNLPSPFSPFFVPRVDFSGTIGSRLRTFGKMVYSRSAARSFEKLMQQERPDIVHIHNIYHQISPSILSVAHKYRAKVVMTLHDFKLICPNYLLFTNGSVCERCKKHKYYQAVLQKCHKNSLVASAAVALETSIHKILRLYERQVDLFIAPSQFVKNTFVDFGQNSEKITVLPHGVPADTSALPSVSSLSSASYFLYVGRLHPTKGVDVLLSAFARLEDKSVRLKIVGEGVSRSFLERKSVVFGIEDRVDFLGELPPRETRTFMLAARAVVVPSVYYETFSLVTAEAMMLGKVVIASQLGALPELVRSEETGFLFPVGNAQTLADRMTGVLRFPEIIRAMEQKASFFAKKQFSLSVHLQDLEDLYRKVRS